MFAGKGRRVREQCVHNEARRIPDSVHFPAVARARMICLLGVRTQRRFGEALQSLDCCELRRRNDPDRASIPDRVSIPDCASHRASGTRRGEASVEDGTPAGLRVTGRRVDSAVSTARKGCYRGGASGEATAKGGAPIIRGATLEDPAAMAFPARNNQDIAGDQSGPAPPDASGDAAEAADLHRLQASLDWLNRERMILARGASVRKETRRLPRAAQLGPVPGISTRAEDSARTPERLPFVPAPPLACERLQRPPPRRRYGSGTHLLVLIAIVLVGSVAYYASAEGFFSTPDIAQASPLQRR
jgi:hypothetical protein